MTDGLHILYQPTGYYGYSIVGWVRCRDGLELDVYGARAIHYERWVDLATLAKKGPQPGMSLRDAVAVESVWRPNVFRAVPCDEKVWHKHCPRPDGWGEES